MDNHSTKKNREAKRARACELIVFLAVLIAMVIFPNDRTANAQTASIIHAEIRSGGSVGADTVTTIGSLAGVEGDLYLAAISMRPKKSVLSVSGLGLTWTLVRSKCAGNNTTGIEVWMAQGTPSGNGTVSARLGSAPGTAVITVSRYSGVIGVNPIGNVIAGNTNGLNANGVCTGGADNSAYAFNLATNINNAVVYVAAAMKARTHTPGPGFIERREMVQSGGANTSSVAVEDTAVAVASTVTVNGSFNGPVDWAVVALMIKPKPPQYTLTVNTISSGSVTLNPPGGVYDAGTVVTLTAAAGAGFEFNNWSDALSGSANPATVTMSVNRKVTANFKASAPGSGPIVYEGTRLGSSSNSATVATSASMIGANGNLYLAAISMQPKKSVLSVSGLGLNWTLLRTKCAGQNTTGLEVWMAKGTPSSDGTVTATLGSAPSTAVIAVSRYSGIAEANAIGSVIAGNTNGLNANGACTGGVDNSAYAYNLNTSANNAVVYVAAAMNGRTHTPGAGYAERGEVQQLNGVTNSSLAVEDKTAASASSVTANGAFNEATDWVMVAVEIKPPIPKYTLTVNKAGSGDVALNPSGGVYDAGTVVTLTATPAAGFQFSGWSGDLSGSANPVNITMDGNKNVTATFTAQYTLTVNKVGSGNVALDPSGGVYDAGTVVTLTATPAAGFQFSGWSGDLSGSANPVNITMNGNKNVTATFTSDFTLTVNILGSGNVALNPSGGIYDPGTVVTLTATPVAGFQFSGWSGDLSGSANPKNITMNANKTVTAIFSSDAPIDQILHQETLTGGSAGATSVATAGALVGVEDQLYLAAISTRPSVQVTAVSGLGLNWTLMKAQCASDNSTSVEVWKAQGTPSSNGAVTATLAGAPSNAAIAVSRYSGVNDESPLGSAISANTNGVNGACSGGVDGSAYSVNLSTTENGAVVYGAVAMRNKTHTPGANYTERADFMQGSLGAAASVAVEDQTITSPSNVVVNGSFNGGTDWAVVAVEIKPLFKLTVSKLGSGSVALNPPGGVYQAGTVVTLTATPAAGFQFDGWSGDLSGTANPKNITMNASKNVTAIFTSSSSGDEIVLEETQTGAVSGSATVTTSANLAGVSGHLYLAAVSSKGRVHVDSVSGLGLAWSLVKKQCSGRGTTMVEVWMAIGAPSSNGPVTAHLPSSNLNAVLVASRYSGVNSAEPIGNKFSGNVDGEDGDCTGDLESSSYSFFMSTTVNEAVVYAAAAMRDKTHTPGNGYTEHAEISQGATPGSMASIAVQDQYRVAAGTVKVDGTFSGGSVDWSMVAVEIKPQASASKRGVTAENAAPAFPAAFQLEQNYPNPFNPSTAINFSLPAAGQVRLRIYDINGQLVRALAAGEMPAGRHSLRWHGNDELNRTVAAGVYLYKLEVSGEDGGHLFTQTRRMLFLK